MGVIQYLSLRSTSIGSAGLLYLAEGLSDYLFLHTLDLAFNRVEGAAGGRAAAKLIGRRPERLGGIPLTKLDLSHNTLGDEGFAAILGGLT